MERSVVLEKSVGETPLEVLERFRASQSDLAGVPLAYAGRLDPMASGQMLVLIGEECKQQEKYHSLDKAYDIEVLLGVTSDSGDVLGLVEEAPSAALPSSARGWQAVTSAFVGAITLPYPAYSSRTVRGVPLHTWAVQGRLGEIEIPKKTSRIFALTYHHTETISRTTLCDRATAKINLLPPVTDPRKALGNDFRRPQVHASWDTVRAGGHPDDQFTIVSFSCICSSGTYMRTLADEIGKAVGTRGLAFSIHRTQIGRYQPLTRHFGLWYKTY